MPQIAASRRLARPDPSTEDSRPRDNWQTSSSVTLGRIEAASNRWLAHLQSGAGVSGGTEDFGRAKILRSASARN